MEAGLSVYCGSAGTLRCTSRWAGQRMTPAQGATTCGINTAARVTDRTPGTNVMA